MNKVSKVIISIGLAILVIALAIVIVTGVGLSAMYLVSKFPMTCQVIFVCAVFAFLIGSLAKEIYEDLF